MQLEVEATGVADGFSLAVAAPQSSGRRVAVGTGQTRSTVTPSATSTTATLLPLALALLPTINISFQYHFKQVI